MKQIKLKFEDIQTAIWVSADLGEISIEEAQEQSDAAEIAEADELKAWQDAENAIEVKRIEGEISKGKKGMMEAKLPEQVMAAYKLKSEAEEELRLFLIKITPPEILEWREKVMAAELELERCRAELAKYIKVAPIKVASEKVSGTAPKNPKGTSARIVELAKQGLTNKEIGIELGYTKEQGYGNGTISPIAKHYR